jgi:hypothetical protein
MTQRSTSSLGPMLHPAQPDLDRSGLKLVGEPTQSGALILASRPSGSLSNAGRDAESDHVARA